MAVCIDPVGILIAGHRNARPERWADLARRDRKTGPDWLGESGGPGHLFRSR